MVSPTAGYTSPKDFRISQTAPTVSDPKVQGALDELYAFAQQVAEEFVIDCGTGIRSGSLWPQLVGSPTSVLAGNMQRLYITAGEALLLGDTISLILSGGILKAFKANATDNTKPADGFCSFADIPSGDIGEVKLGNGILPSSQVLTVGGRYYLSTISGQLQTAKPVAAGNIEQYLGIALTTDTLYFTSHYWIQH